jgi:hypothetical protein
VLLRSLGLLGFFIFFGGGGCSGGEASPLLPFLDGLVLPRAEKVAIDIGALVFGCGESNRL